MKRTTQALRRFGVPVLAVTTLMAGAQVALGTSAFAADALAITPTTGFSTVTPSPPGATPAIQSSVKYTGTGAGVTDQVVSLTVSGSATIVAPGAATGTLVIATGGKSATCTTDHTAADVCTFAVTDTVGEAATVTATDTTNTGASGATSTDNFASEYWSHCSQTTQNTFANCVTQAAVGAITTLTVTYKTAGAAAANVGVTFTDTTTHGTVSPSQPAGTAFFSTNIANCITNAQGQCSVNVVDNTAEANTYKAVTNNTGSYPASEAQTTVNVLASVTPGRLIQQGADSQIQPGTQANGLNMPGDVVKKTYKLFNCGATTGNNVCAQGTALSGVALNLSLDHGFFTAPCVSANGATTNYAQCTFNATPAAGTKVGDIKSSGTTMSVTTDSTGAFTVYESAAKDAGFDDDGAVSAMLTAVAGTTTLTETNAGVSPSGTTCAGGTAGCPASTAWTTNAVPLNGGAVSMAWVTSPALSSTATNEIQIGSATEQNILVLNLTDQFGNLTSGGTVPAPVALTGTGAGRVFSCTGYTSTTPCTGLVTGAFTQPSGTPTYTIAAQASFTQQFSAGGATTQNRYGVDSAGAVTTGTQTLKAAWSAPITTFSTFVAGTATTPAVATYDGTKTNAVSATVTNDFYKPVATNVTFATTPGNSVAAGTVVTVSATVKDQHGQGIAGLVAQFIRSGPQTQNGTSCSATNAAVGTGPSGGAGFSFACTNPSTQVVTIVIKDANGVELARGTQTITFTGSIPPPVKKTIHATITCKSPKAHVLRCVVAEAPRIAGLSVGFFRKTASGLVKIGSARTNSNGVAVLVKRSLKSHKVWKVLARIAGTGTTKPATTGVATVTIK